jgi:hypothetical protein
MTHHHEPEGVAEREGYPCIGCGYPCQTMSSWHRHQTERHGYQRPSHALLLTLPIPPGLDPKRKMPSVRKRRQRP